MRVTSRDNSPQMLIVDDDPNELQALTIGLKLEGLHVVGASTGEEALGLLDERTFEAVLIELMMPQLNGIQLARKIVQKHPGTTVLLMSAYYLSPMQLARADAGVCGFIPKPYRFEELVYFLKRKLDLAMVKPVLDESRQGPGGFLSPYEVPRSYVSICVSKTEEESKRAVSA